MPIEEMTQDDLRLYHVPCATPGIKENWIGCVSVREGYIHKFKSLNRFEKEATKIPEDAKLQDPPSGWGKMYLDPSKRQLVASISEFPAEIVPKGKAYRIEDNGGMAFVCYIDGGSPGQGATCVSVYRRPRTGYIDEDEWLLYYRDLEKTRLYYQEQVCIFENVEQVYLGVDNETNAHGNSILLRLTNGEDDSSASDGVDKYVFVGWEIYSFKLKRKDRVAEYFSRMGNNSVPYPVALTEQSVIFMLDAVWVPREEIAPYIDNEQYLRWETEKITWDDCYYVFVENRIGGGNGDGQVPKLTVTPLDEVEVMAERDFGF